MGRGEGLFLVCAPTFPPSLRLPSQDAQRAIDKLDGFGYDNLILRVEWAAPRAEPGAEGVGGGGPGPGTRPPLFRN